MLSTRAPACSAASRRTSLVVRADLHHAQAVPRRAVLRSAGAALLAAAAAAAAAPGAALAKDFKEALAAKEARRQKLKSSAGDMKTTKKIFKESDYAVSEEARTPSSGESDDVKA
ncbi:hypothetical protein Rsub_06012 [Raphidocelis subcapitata]|uniref:Uncharacterized protein n=1 Tax=Raphidocelis subcapitata TaxID=307507 RepID=A0A2V0P5Z7_9CHLO|nr:hypothetical protein Rsub_06012 [Raphidocelis subcapitata]|eukprot:GBF93280.1 hypothetical protein Rsub_06012 [Raphidocelis subcapitata]